jgi:peptidoglycan/LPS O-acetylase OafA/YrhL
VFLLSGVVAGGVFEAARDRQSGRDGDDPVRSSVRRFAVTGAALVAGSFVIQPVLTVLYPPHGDGRAGPAFLLLRLGLVLLLLSLCYLYERRAGVGGRSVVTLVGRESLLVYTAHLQVIYASIGGLSFHTWVGRSFGYPAVIAATLVLIGLMILLAFWWDRVRRGERRRMRRVQWLALAVFLVAFIVSPG